MASLTLAQLVFALAVQYGHPGRSPYSYEPVPECGSDSKSATCELVPYCSDDARRCRPPKWSRARGAWVRMETKPHALRRLAKISRALSGTAERLIECEKAGSCEPVGWSGTTKTLALSALTVAIHESGLREDVQFGHPPLGRGPAGESCLVQVALGQGPRFASWLPRERRQRMADSPTLRERFAQTLLGDSEQALGRCFEVGMRMLARARTSCEGAQVPWDFGMFSMYGGGKSCNVSPMRSRQKTFQRLNSSRPKPAPELLKLLGPGS